MLSVPGARTRLRPAGGAAVAACAPLGDQDVVSLRAASGGMCRAWGGRRVPAVERGEAFSDHGDDGLFGPLGAAAELARDGRGLSDQLGGGVSVSGVVGAVGPGAPRAAGGGVAGYRRDPVGLRPACPQLPDRPLPDRRVLPASAVGGQGAVAEDAAARAESAGYGGGARGAFCLQRHVETLLGRDRSPGRTSLARLGSLSYHAAFESGGGSGAAWGKRAPAGGGPIGRAAAAQAHALAPAAPG